MKSALFLNCSLREISMLTLIQDALWTPQSMQFISDGKFLAKLKQRQNSLRIMVFVLQLGLTVIGKTQSFKASLI